MWGVSVYRDNGYSTESYTKQFEKENDAISYFSDEVKIEFDDEIADGLVSDQEIQNIINSGIYVYDNEKYSVSITLEVNLDEEDEEDFI